MAPSSISPADAVAARAARPRFSLHRFSLDSWAVAVAVIFILLVVAGVFPRVPW